VVHLPVEQRSSFPLAPVAVAMVVAVGSAIPLVLSLMVQQHQSLPRKLCRPCADVLHASPQQTLSPVALLLLLRLLLLVLPALTPAAASAAPAAALSVVVAGLEPLPVASDHP